MGRQRELEVWKFGGASLADAEAIRRAAGLIAAHRGPLIVVASALGGVTDLLLEGATQAAAGKTDAAGRVAADLLRRHRDVVAALLPAGADRRAMLHTVETAAREYRDLCGAVAVLGHLAPRASDMLVSRGERLSAALLAAAVVRAGRSARYVDAVPLISTDGRYGEAAPIQADTARTSRRALRPFIAAGTIAVIPGFLGRAPDGSVTTLGRGGSDLTATLLARVLGARRVRLWKDVPGILTCDPRLVPDARLIPALHHLEAAELAHYGAKVLHPRALIPITGSRIALEVRSFLTPDLAGTEVFGRRTRPEYPVKAIAVVRGQAIVTVAGKGIVGVHGVAARTFAAVDRERLSISTIFQASSESSIGFTVPEKESLRGMTAVRDAFRNELATGLVDSVTTRKAMAVIAVVGDGMAGTPGVAARVFSALAAGNLNVVAIAQGSSERNISFVVADEDAPAAAQRVHDAFQLSKIGGGRPLPSAQTDIVLLGFGRVGRALADQISSANGRAHRRIVGVVDRSGYVFNPDGLPKRQLTRLREAKEAGTPLAALGGRACTADEALPAIARHAVSRPVIVDVTNDDTGDLLLSAIDSGFDVVLANTKPLAGASERRAELLARAGAAGRRVRYEATVGACMPIIDTYHKLVDSGDRVLRIDGVVSGALMYVLSAVTAGRRFSEAVREAVARGYAEPDPREDLSGRDAARKAVILARLLGYRGAAPVPQDLVPKSLKALTVREFMKRLPALDAEWRERAARAAARGTVLRYVVRATPQSVTARLTTVPVTSPIGVLQGPRNLVAFTTRRCRDEPLIISGPGAGADATAAGILNDIHSLSLR